VLNQTRPLFAALAASLLLSACGGHTPVSSAADRCNEQITLSLAPGVLRTDRVVDDVSEGADVHLKYLRSASTNLHVFTLTADGKDPQCLSALVRLRQDSHIRFAEPDRHQTAFDVSR
jgi:hypothetical protein